MPMTPDFENMPILKGILSSLRQGVAVFSPDRKLLYINPAMAEVTGDGSKSVGGGLSELAQRHRLRTAAGVPLEPKDFPIERAFKGEDTFDETYLYIQASGKHVWLLVSCFRILDEAGKTLYVVATISDVSLRKSREDKLKFLVEATKILSFTADIQKRLAQKARLAVPSLADWCAIDLLVGTSTERVAVVHEDPEKLAFLRTYQKMYPPDPLSPTSVYSVIKSQEPRFVPIITDDMLRASARDDQRAAALRSLGLRSLMVIPIVARGKSLGAMTLAYAESGRVYSEDDLQFFKEFCLHLGVTVDNARLYDAIKKRDAAKDIFLASLSHELRNPLAPIKSSLELLKAKDAPRDVREELDIIEHQFDHMARLLGDLLDATRFTHAKIPINLEHAELGRIVERALKSNEALLRNADVVLRFSQPDTPLPVRADETRVEQAVTNLLSNAVKFTPAGGTIWVDIEREHESALVRVRDSGAGIDPRDLPNIFDMYYQGGHARDSANTGLGIGLLLVQRIVQLHGGGIEARSEGLGKGSEFIIRLPLADAVAASSAPSFSSTGSEARGKRILVVDDNIQAADSLVKLLNKVGAKAEALYSAEETLAADARRFDVTLLDVGMPRMDGYALVRELRNRGVESPIIALTGYGMAEDKEKARTAGFSTHLTKPIGLKELLTAIQNVSAHA